MEAPPPPSGLGNFKGVMLCAGPGSIPDAVQWKSHAARSARQAWDDLSKFGSSEPHLRTGSFGDWLGSGGEKAKACKAQRPDVCNPAKTSSQKRIMCQVEMQMEHVQRFIFSGLRGSGVKPCLGGAGPFQLGALPRRWGFSRRWKLQPFLLGPSNAWP